MDPLDCTYQTCTDSVLWLLAMIIVSMMRRQIRLAAPSSNSSPVLAHCNTSMCHTPQGLLHSHVGALHALPSLIGRSHVLCMI